MKPGDLDKSKIIRLVENEKLLFSKGKSVVPLKLKERSHIGNRWIDEFVKKENLDHQKALLRSTGARSMSERFGATSSASPVSRTAIGYRRARHSPNPAHNLSDRLDCSPNHLIGTESSNVANSSIFLATSDSNYQEDKTKVLATSQLKYNKD